MDQIVNIQYETGRKRFTIQGMESLGHTSLGQSLKLSDLELKCVIKLYEMGIFSSMIDNNISIKSVAISHPVKTRAQPQAQPPEVDTTSDSDTSSADSTGTSKLQLWHTYLKIVKSEHPDLTHKQAQSLAKESFQKWKAEQMSAVN